MVNKEFYSAFAQLSVTIIAIMLAFYGLMLINLSQSVQALHQSTIDNLKQTDDAIRRFSQITEPPLAAWANWSVPIYQEGNVRDIMSTEHWVSSPLEVFNPTILAVNGNYTEAVIEDEQIREWLASINLTRFRANYITVGINLNVFVGMLYEEFPPPPAKSYYLQFNHLQVQYFISTNTSDIHSFQNWLQRYILYYVAVSEARSEMYNALQGMKEANLDAAKSISQTVQQLREMNQSDYSWHIQTLTETMDYNVAESGYYESVFEALDVVYSSANAVETSFNQYSELYSVAYSSIQSPTLLMSIFGVIIPMLLLSVNNRLDSTRRRFQQGISLLVVISVIVFVFATYWGISVIWTQIAKLYLT